MISDRARSAIFALAFLWIFTTRTMAQPKLLNHDEMPEEFNKKMDFGMGSHNSIGVTSEEYCEGCKIVMQEVNLQLDIKEHRTLGETNAYMDEMCEDIQPWYPEYVFKVCTDITKGEHTMTIRGLITMIAGNLEDSVCSLYLKACPEYAGPKIKPGGPEPVRYKRSKGLKKKKQMAEEL